MLSIRYYYNDDEVNERSDGKGKERQTTTFILIFLVRCFSENYVFDSRS